MTAGDASSRHERRFPPAIVGLTLAAAMLAIVLLATGGRSGWRLRAAGSDSRAGAAPGRAATAKANPPPLPLARAVGQLIIATYADTTPPHSILAAVRAGRTGAIILMGDNTAGGVAGTRAAVNALQAAARAGNNPPLLIMTDQEGGEVKRLPGPPDYAAAQMSNPRLAYSQGVATGRLLRRAGVNLDLAPVADVSRIDGFMTREQRTFGSRAAGVARAACSFARGLERVGIGYNLQLYPGLGDALHSTDFEPVHITEPAAEVRADDAAYRACGDQPRASVMVDSASYAHITGYAPAVLAPIIYHRWLPSDGFHGLTMSDSFESGAIKHVFEPALRAIDAGDDMVMYPGAESASAAAYRTLLADARLRTLPANRLAAAAGAVLAYKRALGLT